MHYLSVCDFRFWLSTLSTSYKLSLADVFFEYTNKGTFLVLKRIANYHLLGDEAE